MYLCCLIFRLPVCWTQSIVLDSMGIKQTITAWSAMLICVLFICMMYTLFAQNTIVFKLTGLRLMINEAISFPTKPMRFLVMVQGESCLPKYLSSEDVLGNTSRCNCDVLVLSFKKECKESPPVHIKYIFRPHSTWNQGRNLLLEIGQNRTEKYLYYIFIDDDIKLVTDLKGKKPWPIFFEFLIRVEPAVGVIDYTRNVNRSLDGMKRLGCGKDINNETFAYLNSPNFDSAFNAFHYQAVDYILPYPTTFDNISWCWSGFYAKIMCDLVFPGHTVVLGHVNMINPQHRPYPRNGSPRKDEDWRSIMAEVEARLPIEYHNSTLLKDWKRNGWKNEEKSISHCFSHPTPHMPLVPYSHLDSS